MMAVPTIHLNGTSQDDLISQVREAVDAVRVAKKKLYAAAPNARDYYVQGPDAFGIAQAQHASRVFRLNSVLEELEDLGLAIMGVPHD